MRQIVTAAVPSIAIFLIRVPNVYARIFPATRPSNLPDSGDFGVLFTLVMNWFIGLVGLIAVLMLVIGGFQYLTSGGNEQTIEKAKHTILYAIIGIIIILLAFAIVYTITSSLKAVGDAP